ncbi:unnamed protein product, partial [Ectocarpus sp. 8 AP-2014]
TVSRVRVWRKKCFSTAAQEAMGTRSAARLQSAAPASSRPTRTTFARDAAARHRLQLRAPRGMCFLLVVAAAASLILSLPTASGAGANQGAAASMEARKRRSDPKAGRAASSASDVARVDEHVHDSKFARRRSYSRSGEEGDGERVSDHGGGKGKRRASRNLRTAGAAGVASDSFVPSSSLSSSSSLGGREDDGSGSNSNEDDQGLHDGSSSSSSSSSSCENYDTEEGLWGESTGEEEREASVATTRATSGSRDDSSADEPFSYEAYDSEPPVDDDLHVHNDDGITQRRQRPGREGNDEENSVEVCVLTWNLAEESPPAGDLEFLRQATRETDLVAVGVQEIENLKPRRNEGGRTREWRRLLIRTLGRDFVRVGHHAMGAVQLTLFARREVLDRVKVIKLTEVVCGVGNVLQNKGGIGAYVRVDRTTFLFVAAHLAAHQASDRGRVEERNAGYWRIATTLDQEIPPAWVTHASRKRAKRAKAAAAAAAAAASTQESEEDGEQRSPPVPWLPGGRGGPPVPPQGPFGDRVDRVFFFGDLNYRVDLSREDLELGVVSICGRRRAAEGAGEGKGEREAGGRFRPG